MSGDSSVNQDIRNEIAALIAAEDDAWNQGSVEGFAARALPDVIFTNIIGMFSVGKAPFVAQHEHIFATIYKGSRLHQDVQHIALITPDVAIVDTLSTLTGFQHAPPGVDVTEGAIQTRLEQVLLRRSDGWWMASLHNVAINAAASNGAPANL